MAFILTFKWMGNRIKEAIARSSTLGISLEGKSPWKQDKIKEVTRAFQPRKEREAVEPSLVLYYF
jgi:hypothetical protein